MNAAINPPSLFSPIHYRNVNGCAERLRHRSLSGRYLSDWEIGLDNLRRKLPRLRPDMDLLDVLPTPKERKLFVMHRDYSGRHYQPNVVIAAANPDLILYSETRFPVFINAPRTDPHVRLRYERRTDHAFGSDQIDYLLAATITFLKFLEKHSPAQVRVERGERFPFYVPDERGMFLCHMEKIPDSEIDPDLSILRTRSADGLTIADPKSNWRPKVRAFVNSYISVREMFWSQKNAFDQFHASIDAEMWEQALSARWAEFIGQEPVLDEASKKLISQTPQAKLLKEMKAAIPIMERCLAELFYQPLWAVIGNIPDTQLPLREEIDLSGIRRLPELDCLRTPHTAPVRISPEPPPLPGLGRVPYRPTLTKKRSKYFLYRSRPA